MNKHKRTFKLRYAEGYVELPAKLCTRVDEFTGKLIPQFISRSTAHNLKSKYSPFKSKYSPFK